MKGRAHIVVDLGFGDAGKGRVTDAVARASGAAMVVRFNGGAQAGHNVVTPTGEHHTFSQFSSGTFLPGVRTLLSGGCVLHPGALRVEASALEAKGVTDPLSRLLVSSRALVTTPLHQAANRIRELGRGAARHGSCGVGLGETVDHALRWPEEAIRVEHLGHAALVHQKLLATRVRKRDELREQLRQLPEALQVEARPLEDDAVLDAWLSEVASLVPRLTVLEDRRLLGLLRTTGPLVFEGAQGVLLDEEAGFSPYTTWSRCTAANARELLARAGITDSIRCWGVLRTHQVRHGPGPLPTEDGRLNASVREHNQENPWQGSVRYGWFDAALARYALVANQGVDALALTHLDTAMRMDAWGVRPPDGGPLLIARPEVVFQEADPSRIVATVERLLEVKVALRCFGPTVRETELREA